jgi:hypothetical protein
VTKDLVHVRHLRRIPGPDRLVEHFREIKHSIQAGYFGRVPISNILVESIRVIKHESHISHLRRVPISNVSIKRYTTSKHLVHICYLRSVPIGNIAVEISYVSGVVSRPETLMRCPPSAHIRHQTRVPVGYDAVIGF